MRRDVQDIRIRLDSSAPAHNGWHLPPDLPAPSQRLICDARTRATRLEHGSGVLREWNDPLEALRWFSSIARAWSDECWVGFLSYDLGRLFESLPARASDDLDLPLFAFTRHSAHEHHAPLRVGRAAAPADAPLRSNFDAARYRATVRRCIDYIAAGDVFQVNLSQRFTVGQPACAADVYDRLRTRSPAAYGALLDHGDFAILSNSPELFLHVTPDRRVITRPIKGTRRRHSGMDAELLASPKDQAELNMIIDLERNDLGRVCEIGSVRVTQPRTIEAHPTVYHGVATVEGRLRADVDFVDLLRATFPGGSVTGAPKIRAMEIIDELEPVRRGPYCGAIGYLAADGSMQFGVAIRTMTFKDGLAHVPVGGGIVADSDPAAEYDETLVKAKAMFDALGIAYP
jgi:anthranilate/para-aminobenzoate synthase component I